MRVILFILTCMAVAYSPNVEIHAENGGGVQYFPGLAPEAITIRNLERMLKEKNIGVKLILIERVVEGMKPTMRFTRAFGVREQREYNTVDGMDCMDYIKFGAEPTVFQDVATVEIYSPNAHFLTQYGNLTGTPIADFEGQILPTLPGAEIRIIAKDGSVKSYKLPGTMNEDTKNNVFDFLCDCATEGNKSCDTDYQFMMHGMSALGVEQNMA